MKNSDIRLSTPLEEIHMPDKLRTRLQISGCSTFRDAMTLDYDAWENVSAKVVNAMKRFRDSYSDLFSIQEKKEKDNVASSTSSTDDREERRFYVANNILNAYISSGQLLDSPLTYPEAMKKIMLAADAFLASFYGEETGLPTADINPMADKGEEIRITAFTGQRAPANRSFQVGDTVTVTRMRQDSSSGIIKVTATLRGKEIKFDSSRYQWMINH